MDVSALIQATSAFILAIVAAAGFIINNNLSRQMALQITDKRFNAYAALWEKMDIAAPSRLKSLNQEEREQIYHNFTSWYFTNGNGMLLTSETRELYLCVKNNLACECNKIEPDSLRTEERKTEEGRSILSIRQLSLLRTRMKADLELYGSYFFGDLNPDDKELLRHCGQQLDKMPWVARGVVQKATSPADA